MKALIAAILLTFALNATAQETWLTKPYEQWTANEAAKLLSDSPWTFTTFKLAPDTRYQSGMQYPPGTTFMAQVRLYSALPVRQALVRRMQLAIPYSDLTVAQRADFDAEVDGLLKCPLCADYYILTLRSSREDRFTVATLGNPYIIDVVGLLKSVPEDELPQHVTLTSDKGERRKAARVSFSKRNEALFLFKRLDDQGHPLITVSNKKFKLEFDDYLSGKLKEALKTVTFDVKKLRRGDEVIF